MYHYVPLFFFAAWGKKRSVIIVRPDAEDFKGDNGHSDSGSNESGSGSGSGSGEDIGESSGESEQVRASQRSEIAQVKTKGE